jgi:uncharacterized protein YcbK (DUF882 family)
MKRKISNKLTENFWEHEFDCNHCGMYIDSLHIAKELQRLRDWICTEVGKNIRIRLTNALRCPEHNKKVGGVEFSRHLPLFFEKGEGAADVYSPDIGRLKFRRLVKKAWKEGIIKGGCGLYFNFCHIDCSAKRKWGLFWNRPK